MKNLTVNMPLAVPHQRPPSKYASHPYPVLVDEDAYSSTSLAISAIQRTILHRANEVDSYISTVKPLSSAVRDLLIEKYVEDAYVSTATALSASIRDLLITRRIDDPDAYVSTAKPLSASSKEVLIRYYNPDPDAYVSTATALSAYMIETAIKGYAQDFYMSSASVVGAIIDNDVVTVGHKWWRLTNITARTDGSTRFIAEIRFNDIQSYDTSKAFSNSFSQPVVTSAGKAFDGNPTTWAQASNSLNGTNWAIGYEFNEDIVISSVSLQMYHNTQSNFGTEWQTADVQVSDDGVTWVKYGTIEPRIAQMDLSLITTPIIKV